jgi:hypothetical protein
MTNAERKADTRRKIQLGELIIKARVATEEPAVLLGMLTAGARVLRTKNGYARQIYLNDATLQALKSPPASVYFS